MVIRHYKEIPIKMPFQNRRVKYYVSVIIRNTYMHTYIPWATPYREVERCSTVLLFQKKFGKLINMHP